MCLHHETCEEWVEIWKSVLLYTWYLYRFEFIGQAQKSIKQFLYMAMEGNRGIWFGAIFPYMVMEGTEGILFSAITNTVDVTVLLELVLYHSSIDFNPIILLVWKALHAYEAHFSWFNATTGIADNVPILQTRCTFYIHSQWFHDSHLYRNKSLCHISLPYLCHISLSTKYNTTCIRHTLMDTKFNHCGGTHCWDHSDLNEMCKLWVKVKSHLQITVTLS